MNNTAVITTPVGMADFQESRSWKFSTESFLGKNDEKFGSKIAKVKKKNINFFIHYKQYNDK